MQIINNIVIFGDPIDQGALDQITRCQTDAVKVALMGDHHKGYSVPIGGVVAYKDAISPSGVGYDIGCGNKAVLTDLFAKDIMDRLPQLMDSIVENISFGIGRKNNTRVDHPIFDEMIWTFYDFLYDKKDKARNQLGTIGSGNHYVDILVDELDRVWVGVHFGSRGLGHGIATHFLEAGGAKDGMDEMPLVFSTTSDLGEQYIECMELAGAYAYAGRDWVCDEVCRILGGVKLEIVHNHHNYAWKEHHEGYGDLWVVRKDATPAFPGQRGFVGGSMGDDCVILEGIASDASKQALYSTVHGAGRIMSRTAARGKVNRKTGEVKSVGSVTKEMMRNWIDKRGVELRGADVDESPHCYKRLDEVLRHHEGTVKIVHTLRPVGVAMASKDVVDPWKD